MLPDFIIDKILDRERRERVDNRPQISLDIPLPSFDPQQADTDTSNRGVVIIELGR